MHVDGERIGIGVGARARTVAQSPVQMCELSGQRTDLPARRRVGPCLPELVRVRGVGSV
jgi:hypothetical protein